MLVMNKEDVFANKLVALLERSGKTNRDIYDVCFFLKKQFPINISIVESRTQLSYKNTVLKCVEILEKKAIAEFYQGLANCLMRSKNNRQNKIFETTPFFY